MCVVLSTDTTTESLILDGQSQTVLTKPSVTDTNTDGFNLDTVCVGGGGENEYHRRSVLKTICDNPRLSQTVFNKKPGVISWLSRICLHFDLDLTTAAHSFAQEAS